MTNQIALRIGTRFILIALPLTNKKTQPNQTVSNITSQLVVNLADVGELEVEKILWKIPMVNPVDVVRVANVTAHPTANPENARRPAAKNLPQKTTTEKLANVRRPAAKNFSRKPSKAILTNARRPATKKIPQKKPTEKNGKHKETSSKETSTTDTDSKAGKCKKTSGKETSTKGTNENIETERSNEGNDTVHEGWVSQRRKMHIKDHLHAQDQKAVLWCFDIECC